jgi:tripartite-type tricarboxylate transporter receptor subunit TctC
MKAFSKLALAAATFLLAASTSNAQSAYPSQTVRIIVPFGAGSVTDTLARIIADKLGAMWKQAVVVENRPGPPGAAAAAKAPADGYTLMLTSNGHVISNLINKNVSFDPVADFSGVTKLVEAPFVMIATPNLPAKTLPEFLALAKKAPGIYNFSSAGISSTSYLMTETMRQAANINIVHVPFKGTPDAVTAVLRGDVAFYMAPIPDSIAQAKVGAVRMLAISSARRLPRLPDLPTISESVPSFSYETWFGLMAPAATPHELIDRINKDVHAVLKMPDVIDRLDAIGSLPTPDSPAEFDAVIRSDAAKYAAVIKAAGIGN